MGARVEQGAGRSEIATGRGGVVRLLLPLAFLLGFGGLEIAHAVDRVAEERERRRARWLAAIDEQQDRSVREVSGLVGEGANHATHLARSPLVAAVLDDASSAAADELGRVLLPYLASFRGIDRLSVLDAEGHERFRCERMGGGVAWIPTELLEAEPRTALLALAPAGADDGVAVSPLLVDAARVEVDEARRRVFHYVERLPRSAPVPGLVVVTVYATPLVDALARIDAVDGTTSWLLDEEGELFAAPPGRSGEDDPDLLAELSRAALSGVGRTDAGDAILFARATGKAPCSWLVSRVPLASLERAVDELEVTLWPTLLRTLAVLAAIAIGSALFARATLRARRLRETECYLARIQEESAKHRALMEAAADVLLVVAPDRGDVRDSNARASEVLGAVASGTSLDALGPAFGDEGLARLREGVRAAASRPGAPVPVTGLELRARGGERLEVEARCVGLRYAGESLVEVALSDRTREREMERRVRTAERLSSVGLLTAGVAHEINNPLEGIANYLSLLERAPDDESRARYVERLRVGFRRIRDIVGDLLRFAGPERDGATADLAQVVERVVSLASLSKDLKGVRVQVEGLSEPLVVAGGEGRLEQVLLNLLLNAGRATGGSGRVRLRGDRSDPEHATVDVEDDGPGIAEEDLPRVFDPFFTRSGGTGLGLSVSYGIVRAHGGELYARNRPGGGARFTLKLPREPRSVAETEDDADE